MTAPIFNVSPFTLLDYPNKTACILWFAGCNMRCQYCYNPEIVLGKGKISYEQVLKFLGTRINLLDGVVLSGGECLSHRGIKNFAKEIKAMGFLVKVDTNGSHPLVLQDLLQKQLVDYVSLDFKGSKRNFGEITESTFFENTIQAAKVLVGSKIDFEIRTTLHSVLFMEKDVQEILNILESIGYQGNYYLQKYRDDKSTLRNLEKSGDINLSGVNSKSGIVVVFRG